MLILTRRPAESVMIADEIVITILGVQGNQVRLGIRAPRDIAVHREEIYVRIQAEKQGLKEPHDRGERLPVLGLKRA